MITKTKKIFIGGLSATSTVEDMKQYFEQFGKVSVRGGFRVFGRVGIYASLDRAICALEFVYPRAAYLPTSKRRSLRGGEREPVRLADESSN